MGVGKSKRQWIQFKRAFLFIQLCSKFGLNDYKLVFGFSGVVLCLREAGMETVWELFADDVEKVIAELSEAVKNAIQTTKLKERFKDLDSTLEKFEPLSKFMVTRKKKQKDIPKHKKGLDQSNNEAEMVKHIENGKALVVCCSKQTLRNPFSNNDQQVLDLVKSLNWLLRKLISEERRIGLKNLLVSRKNGESVVIQDIEVEFPDLALVPEPPDVTVGLDEPLWYLKEMLLKDAPLLMLTGPGGRGKSTLAMKFCQDEEVKDKFKKSIFFLILSKEPYLDIVQQLYQLMKSQEAGQDPLLLVLDDVRSESKSLLQKFCALNLQNCKILVTSRSEFSEFGTPYNLEPLKAGDSMRLLRHSASLEDGLSVPEDLLREVLKHCRGVPLTITVTGKSFRGIATEFWLSRLTDWFKGSTPDSGLQSSIDALGEKDINRECFMDLASFPEDQRISAAAFIDMWAELYNNPNEDFQSIRILQELGSRSLANLVSTRKENIEILDNYYTEHFVSQHDLLRNLAIHNAEQDPIKCRKRLIVVSGHNQPQWLTKRKSDQPINARLLSISSDDKFLEQFSKQLMTVPQVEVLVLNFKTQNNALPNFVQKILKLKVLIVTSYGSLPTDLSNFHLLKSCSNLKRIRLERISIGSITKNLAPLKSLKKISLFMCKVGQAFRNCSIKISDAWPVLEEMNIDYCHDLRELPVELCDLVRMKMLSITNCHNLSALPEEIGKLENLEVLRTRSCTDLESLPVSIAELTKLRGLDLYSCISIKELPEGIGNMSSLRKINMGQCSKLEKLVDLPQSVNNLNKLEEVICDEGHIRLWEPFPFIDKIKVAKEKHDLSWLELPPQ